jgi:mannose-6-phosphate isomerase
MPVPVHLPSNQPADRFYRGGEKIRQFRTVAAAGDRVPEDWVGSTTTLFGDPEIGLTRLPEGEVLRDEITSDPQAWLGAAHVETFGPDAMLLVKLLDAGERLPVHLHPDGDFAHQHLGAAHGKAEAWYMLDGGTVYLGFARDVSADEVAGWVERQDVEAMLDAMHAVEVSAGDSVYVPPGMPHAIGAGIFLVEVQEPEDMSILLEWRDFDVDGASEGHLGLGFEAALGAVDRRGRTEREIEALVVRGAASGPALAAGSERYFRAERHEIAGTIVLDPGFSVLVVLEGGGFLAAGDGHSSELRRGDTVLVPHSAGELMVNGDVTLLRCRPPQPAPTDDALSPGVDPS